MVLYEGGPVYPDAGRFWKLCQEHGVTIFYTAPTAIRALMKLGDSFPKQYDLSKLRLLGSVGEPINPEAWMWYQRTIGGERCPIVDTWWQTETGAIMISPVPGVTATKPGSCTKPLPGIFADIVDDEGKSVTRADAGGYLVIRRPWPSMLRTIYGDNDRYLSTYWEKFQNRFYVAGDSAHRDKDGYFWIMGRIDDVLNVAGHRLGTMEIESALVSHPRVAEAAVVGRPHEVKGESVFAFVVCRGERPTGDVSKLIDELRKWVSQELGALARPDDIRFADNLPKTRSGKIMRRLLRSVARGDEITQDVSTLENPAILDQLRGGDAAATAKLPKLKKSAPAKKQSSQSAVPVAAAKKSAKASQTSSARATASGTKAGTGSKVRVPAPTKGAPESKAARSAQPARAVKKPAKASKKRSVKATGSGAKTAARSAKASKSKLAVRTPAKAAKKAKRSTPAQLAQAAKKPVKAAKKTARPKSRARKPAARKK
jgi:AMP-binding enzyme/AMP-binding enzyme C-terminal domain